MHSVNPSRIKRHLDSSRRLLQHRTGIVPTATAALMLCATVAITGCTGPAEPLRNTREALGTVVTIDAYGSDANAMKRVTDTAFEEIASSERALSAYPDSTASPPRTELPADAKVLSVEQFNREPYEWHTLQPTVTDVLNRIEALGVGEYFSPALLRIVGLYDFEGERLVPAEEDLTRLVAAARAFERRVAGEGVEARFRPTETIVAPPRPLTSSYAPPAVGLDLSGAAKGSALDGALGKFEDAVNRGQATGALITAGSTTIVTGRKADGSDRSGGEPWRIGIEDPREPEKIVGVVEYSLEEASSGPGGRAPFGTVSTSGDYQQSFVRDGVRYHHILDPRTGKPAREMRSLTVVGARSGLDSDILSTALFVMGVDRAETYAREHGLGLFIVDARGRTRIVPGPASAPWRIRKSESGIVPE